MFPLFCFFLFVFFSLLINNLAIWNCHCTCSFHKHVAAASNLADKLSISYCPVLDKNRVQSIRELVLPRVIPTGFKVYDRNN